MLIIEYLKHNNELSEDIKIESTNILKKYAGCM